MFREGGMQRVEVTPDFLEGLLVGGYKIAHCRDGGNARNHRSRGRWLQFRIRAQRSGGEN